MTSKNKPIVFLLNAAERKPNISIIGKLTSTRYLFTQQHKSLNHRKKLLIFTSNNQQRFQTSQNAKNSSNKNSTDDRKSGFFGNGFKYLTAVTLGTTTGLVTGYWLMRDQYKIENENEQTRQTGFQATRFIEHKDSPYANFPLSFHLYQYASCPYCAQIRAYFDYFGFSYYVTEVDSYNKEELVKFTRARQLPILVIEDRVIHQNGRKGQKFHLTNATAILSGLESLRNDKPINYNNILNQYLPVLKGNTLFNTSNPFKYHVGNSQLNSIEWRRWINNNAIPAFKLNAISNLKDLFETFDYYSKKSDWRSRYNSFKYLFVYYSNAFQTYFSSSALKEQLNPFYYNKTPRETLNEVVTKWEEGLGSERFMSGRKIPDLADLSMYGNVKAYEGCALFRESIAKHPKFKEWFENMKIEILNGYNRKPITSKTEKAKFSFDFFLKSLDSQDLAEIEPKPVVEVASQTPTEIISQEEPVKKDLDDTELTLFRVLTVTYLIHVFAFTFAAWSK